MAGIGLHVMLARARLCCGKCHRLWESPIHEPAGFMPETGWCEDAWRAGWRVYAGKRSQHTYCPGCAPTVPMRQIYPRGEVSA